MLLINQNYACVAIFFSRSLRQFNEHLKDVEFLLSVSFFQIPRQYKRERFALNGAVGFVFLEGKDKYNFLHFPV